MADMRSQEDWIVCLAIMKYRCPLVWNRLEGTGKAKNIVWGDYYSILDLIPLSLKHKFKQKLFEQLDPFLKFIKTSGDISFKSEDLDIVKSFGEDITKHNFSQILYPKYIFLLNLISSMDSNINEGKNCKKSESIQKEYYFFTFLQKFIVCYLCLQVQDDNRFFTEYLVDKFTFRPYLSILSQKNQTISIRTLITLQKKIFISIVNNKLSYNLNPMQVPRMLNRLFVMIESLLHVLISYQDKIPKSSKDHRAFLLRYMKSKNAIEPRYLHLVHGKVPNTPRNIDCLKIILTSSFETLRKVDWKTIARLLEDYPYEKTNIIQKRLNIISCLLVLKDHAMLTKFRLIEDLDNLCL